MRLLSSWFNESSLDEDLQMEDAAVPRKLFKIDAAQKPRWPTKLSRCPLVDQVFPDVTAAVFMVLVNGLI